MADLSISVLGKDMLSASFSSMQKSVAGLSGEVMKLSNQVVGPAAVAIGNLFSDITKNGVNALIHLKQTIESFSFIRLNMEMEGTRSSFTTLLKSGEAANEMLDTLRQYANQTPFEFTQLTAATKKMLAFGFSASEITSDFMGIGTGLLDVVGNAASALGAGQEGIDRITRALGQMRGLARVSAEDMNQLIDVGVQGYQILAEQLGMTVKEVREAMKKGNIDAEVGIKALLQGMMQQYGGGMKAFSQTAEGMSSTLNDYLADIQRAFGQIAYKEYRNLLDQIGKLVASPNFTKFANMLGVVFGGAIKRLNQQILLPAIQRMQQFVDGLGSTDAGLQQFFNDVMKKLYPFTAFLRELIQSFSYVSKNVAAFVKAFLSLNDTKQVINFVMFRIAEFTETLYKFRSGAGVTGAEMLGFAQKLMSALKPAGAAIVSFVPIAKEAIKTIGDFAKILAQLRSTQSLLSSVTVIYENLSSVFDMVVPRLIRFREALPAMTQTVIEALVPARNALSGFFSVLQSSGLLILTFIRNILGLKTVQSAIQGVPELVNQIGNALHLAANGIDSVTAQLPQFFSWVSRLPDAIGRALASMIPIGGVIESVKNYFKGLINEGTQFILKFTLVGRIFSITMEVVKRLTTSLAPLAQFLSDIGRALASILGLPWNPKEMFGALAAGVSQALTAINAALPSFTTIYESLSNVANSIRVIVPVVIGFAEAIGSTLFSSLKIIQPYLMPIILAFGNLLRVVPPLASALGKVGNDFLSFAMPFVGPAMTGVLGWLTSGAQSLTRFLDTIHSAASTGDWSTVKNNLLTFVSGIADSLGTVLGKVFTPENIAWALTTGRVVLMQTVGGIISDALKRATDGVNFSSLVESAKSWGQRFIDALIIELKNSWVLLTNNLDFSETGILNSLSVMWDGIVVETRNKGQEIVDNLQNIPSQISSYWNEHQGEVQIAAERLGETLKGAYTGTWQYIRDNIGTRDDWVTTVRNLYDELANLSIKINDTMSLWLGGAIDSIASFMTGDTMRSAWETLRNDLGFGAEEIGFRVGVLVVDAFKAMLKTGADSWKNFYLLLIDQGPVLIAGLITVLNEISSTLNITILRAIQGLIEGILAALGLTDWIPAVARFFDAMVKNIEDSSRDIQQAMNAFSTWWQSLEITTTFNNFVSFMTNFITNILPNLLQVLGGIPGALLDILGNSIRSAMTNVLTIIQNALTDVFDSLPGGSYLSDRIRSLFQGWRDEINATTNQTTQLTQSLNDVRSIMSSGLIGDVNAVISSGVSGTASGGNANYVTNNSKNVNMQVTINQSTPTPVADNLRYAQALAQAKIY